MAVAPPDGLPAPDPRREDSERAMALRVDVKPELLRWARERARLPIEDLLQARGLFLQELCRALHRRYLHPLFGFFGAQAAM